MADPDPIALSLKGKATILVAQRSDEQFAPVRMTDAGEVLTSGGGGGGGGGTVDQGAAGASPWLIEISHPIESDGVDYVRTKDKNSDALLVAVGTPAQEHTAANEWQTVRLSNGTGFIAPVAAGDNVLADLRVGDSAVSNSNPVPVSDAGGTITVDGPLTDVQLRATAVPVSGTFWQATQPVSGTVTANIGTSGNLALDSTLTGGTAKAIARGGAKGTTSAADVTSTAQGSNNQALDVVIWSGGSVVAPATAAKQPALGIAGSASTDVITVQGIASGVALNVDTELPAAAALGDTTSVSTTTTFVGVGAFVADTASTTQWKRWRGDTNGGYVQGPGVDGAAVTGRPLIVAGSDGSNAHILRTDAIGRMSVIGNRVARTAHLASATLPAAGAFTAQTAYTVPEGVIGITAYVTYTRGTTNGTVLLRPEWGNGTETAREAIVTVSTASSENQRDTVAYREFVSQSVDTTFALEFVVPAGTTTFRLLAAELGVTATPGTCQITLTAKYGGA